ncbi:MAG: nucleoside phosphorylase [Actinomycetota bacterium]
MSLQYHVRLSPGDVAPSVLLPGDPGRVEAVASLWDEARHVASNREYVTFTGSYRGVPISCTSTGIGSASTAIALEELARVGATTFVRIGTCGSLRDQAGVGDIAIFDSAIRADGASELYAPLEFPAASHHEVVSAAILASTRLGVPHHIGTTFSTDLFYVPERGSAFGGYEQSAWRERWDDVRRTSALAVEMETGVLLVLARIWGLRAGAVALVSDVALEKIETGEFDPQATFDVSEEPIERLARVGCEIVATLAERDAARR